MLPRDWLTNIATEMLYTDTEIDDTLKSFVYFIFHNNQNMNIYKFQEYLENNGIKINDQDIEGVVDVYNTFNEEKSKKEDLKDMRIAYLESLVKQSLESIKELKEIIVDSHMKMRKTHNYDLELELYHAIADIDEESN